MSYCRAFSKFPVHAEKAEVLTDSYWRRYIPGTNTLYGRGYHYGIDIPCPIGTPVVAPDGGTVVAVGNIWGSAYGYNQVLILHTAALGTIKWYTFYAHMENRTVSKGQVIKAGQLIGHSGAQGNVSGPHLHMELHTGPGWRQVFDPYPITHSTLYTRLRNAQLLATG